LRFGGIITKKLFEYDDEKMKGWLDEWGDKRVNVGAIGNNTVSLN